MRKPFDAEIATVDSVLASLDLSNREHRMAERTLRRFRRRYVRQNEEHVRLLEAVEQGLHKPAWVP